MVELLFNSDGYILNKILSYLDGDYDRVNFIKAFKKCNFNNNDVEFLSKNSMYLKNTYTHLQEIKTLLEDGFHIFVSNEYIYTYEWFHKYKNQIYGCSINNLEELKYFNIEKIIELRLNISFKEQIINDKLPPNLKGLYFDSISEFDYSIDDLPDNIEYLQIHQLYNKKINKFPAKLKSLIFSQFSIYNYSIDNLPEGIETLQLGEGFSQPINNLPLSIRYLIIKCSNINSIDLQEGITHLIIEGNYNKSIDNLPDSITHLYMYNNYNEQVTKLPKKLKELHIIEFININNFINIPDNLKIKIISYKDYYKLSLRDLY